jgi:hypothetical protein
LQYAPLERQPIFRTALVPLLLRVLLLGLDALGSPVVEEVLVLTLV